MATSSTSQSLSRARILDDCQAFTGLGIDDAICFLDQYDWKLDRLINDYYNPIESKQKSEHNPDLGRFYSLNNETKEDDENSDRHYAESLSSYGDTGERTRPQQTEPIYHEKQRLMRCGLHSLNNLFQAPKLFTPSDLNSIAREYDKSKFFNDYRTLLLGNYDLRILIEAIGRFGFDVRQVDVDREGSIHYLSQESFFGLLINLNGTHWFTIKNLNGIYYNLDSTLRKPIELGRKEGLEHYLTHLLRRTRTIYIFVVTGKNA